MTEPANRLDQLIEAERAQLVPASGASERGWAALEARLEAGASPVVDVPPPAAASGHLGKVLVLVGILGVVAIGFGVIDREPNEPAAEQMPVASAPEAATTTPDPPPASPPEAVAPDAPKVEVDEPAPQPVEEAEPEPATRQAPRHGKAPRPHAETGGADSMEDELKILEEAKSALNRKDAAGALSALARHRKQFPRGLFVEEREAMRVEALCAAGRGEEGERAQSRFMKRYPKSPFIGRVEGACK